MAQVVRQEIDDLHGILTVTIEKEDYAAKVEKELQHYKREAQLKGFRKGKAPEGFIRKMYGRSITAKAVTDLLQFEVQEYLYNQNIDLLGQPLPQEDQESYDFDPNTLIDYVFNFDIAYPPKFEVQGISPNDTFEEYVIEISDKEIDEELNALRTRHTEPTYPEFAGSENDVLNLRIEELDANGEPNEEGVSHVFSAFWRDLTEDAKKTFGKLRLEDQIQWDPYALFADRDEEYVKKYVLGLNASDEVPQGKTFRFTVNKISSFNTAELNQAFFDKAFGEGKVTSEQEARDLIKSDIQAYFAKDASNLLFISFQNKLIELNQPPMPEDFLKRWVRTTVEDISDEKVDAGFASLLKSLRWTLIKNKLTSQFNIEVSEEEVDEKLKLNFMAMFGNSPYITEEVLESLIKRAKEDEKEVRRIVDNVLLDKLHESIKQQVKIVGKPISAEEFAKVRDETYRRIEAENKASSELEQQLDAELEEENE